MGDAKHTPGRWFPTEDFSMVLASGMMSDDAVCEVFAGGNGSLDANARLIAASPTMAEYIQRKADAGDVEAAAIMEAVHAPR